MLIQLSVCKKLKIKVLTLHSLAKKLRNMFRFFLWHSHVDAFNKCHLNENRNTYCQYNKKVTRKLSVVTYKSVQSDIKVAEHYFLRESTRN